MLSAPLAMDGTEPPRTVGRYTIYGEIASGGMASVHFARLAGPSGFSRTVAIKRAHPHLARDMDFALMFMDEARLASRIRHSNVVATIDVLNTANDLVLVMDYVHGESLWKLVKTVTEKNERVPAPIAAAILIDTLHGLHAAHEAKDEQGEPLGIVHRDVSPHNILVGVDGISRLVDFGIAKAAGRLHSTRDSHVKGKYAYMAPEQVRGEPVSRLADTYAASIVFWELLTGQRLFVGKTEAETIHKCLVARVQPPSMFAPEIGKKLDEIVKKGLSREPGRRYQTAREMALDIESCVAAVRPSEIGAWVEQTAGESLQARAAVLAEIENGTVAPARDAGAMATAPEPWVVAGAGSQTLTRASMSGEIEPQTARTGGTPVSARSRRATIVSAALVSLLVGSGAAALVMKRGASVPSAREDTSETRGEATRGGPGVSVPPVTPSASPPAVVTALSPASPPPSAATSLAKAEPTAKPVSVGPRPSHYGSSGRSGRPKRSACDPPYSIDSEGRQIFKPECM